MYNGYVPIFLGVVAKVVGLDVIVDPGVKVDEVNGMEVDAVVGADVGDCILAADVVECVFAADVGVCVLAADVGDFVLVADVGDFVLAADVGEYVFTADVACNGENNSVTTVVAGGLQVDGFIVGGQVDGCGGELSVLISSTFSVVVGRSLRQEMHNKS